MASCKRCEPARNRPYIIKLKAEALEVQAFRLFPRTRPDSRVMVAWCLGFRDARCGIGEA